jgi:hypothetical protein
MTFENFPTLYKKPVFSGLAYGELSILEYIDYLGLRAKEREITQLIPNVDLKQFPREHPTKENYSGLVKIAVKAGLRS